VNKRFSSLTKRHLTAGLPAGQKIRGLYILAGPIRISLIFFTVSLLLFQTVCAQKVATPDSLIISKHSPRKATIYSMVLPGLGQAYNKKYWKIPIIYAGFGALAYFIHTNNVQYLDFKAAYKYKSDTTNPYPAGNPYVDKYDVTQCLEGQNFYRRNLEVSYMLSAVLYLLNVVDAAVDAHFFDFNIKDDLTLHVQPFMNPSPMAIGQRAGLRLSLTF
jgi:hypothetical protein